MYAHRCTLSIGKSTCSSLELSKLTSSVSLKKSMNVNGRKRVSERSERKGGGGGERGRVRG